MIKEDYYDTLNENLISGRFRFTDSRFGLNDSIKASILYYIDQNPQLTLFQIFHNIRYTLNDNVDCLEKYLKNAYPRANPKIQKRVDIKKIFIKSS